MDENDPIHQLLLSTGWTPEDLLKRLEQYKTGTNVKVPSDNNSKENSRETQQKDVNDFNESSVHENKEDRDTENISNKTEKVNETSNTQNRCSNTVECTDDNSDETNVSQDKNTEPMMCVGQTVDNKNGKTGNKFEKSEEGGSAETLSKRVNEISEVSGTQNKLNSDSSSVEFIDDKSDEANLLQEKNFSIKCGVDKTSKEIFEEPEIRSKLDISSNSIEVIDDTEFIDDLSDEVNKLQEKNFSKGGVDKTRRLCIGPIIESNGEGINTIFFSKTVKETLEEPDIQCELDIISNSVEFIGDNSDVANASQLEKNINECSDDKINGNKDNINKQISSKGVKATCNVPVIQNILDISSNSVELIDDISDEANASQEKAIECDVNKTIVDKDDDTSSTDKTNGEDVSSQISSKVVKQIHEVPENKNKLDISSNSVQFVDDNSDEKDAVPENNVENCGVDKIIDNGDGRTDPTFENNIKDINTQISSKVVDEISEVPALQNTLDISSAAVEFIDNSLGEAHALQEHNIRNCGINKPIHNGGAPIFENNTEDINAQISLKVVKNTSEGSDIQNKLDISSLVPSIDDCSDGASISQPKSEIIQAVGFKDSCKVGLFESNENEGNSEMYSVEEEKMTNDTRNVTNSSVEFIDNSDPEEQIGNSKVGLFEDNQNEGNGEMSSVEEEKIIINTEHLLNVSNSSVEFVDNSDTEEQIGNTFSKVTRLQNVGLTLRSNSSSSVEFIDNLDCSEAKQTSILEYFEDKCRLKKTIFEKKCEENNFKSITDNTEKGRQVLYVENGPNSATITALCEKLVPDKRKEEFKEISSTKKLKDKSGDGIVKNLPKQDNSLYMLVTSNKPSIKNTAETVSDNCEKSAEIRQNPLSSSTGSSCVEIIEDSEDANNDNFHSVSQLLGDYATGLEKKIGSTTTQTHVENKLPLRFYGHEDYSSDDTCSEVAQMGACAGRSLSYIDDDDDEDDYFEETCERLPNFEVPDNNSNQDINLGKHTLSDESNFSDESFILRLDPDTDKENGEEHGTSHSEIESRIITSNKSSELNDEFPSDIGIHQEMTFSVACRSDQVTDNNTNSDSRNIPNINHEESCEGLMKSHIDMDQKKEASDTGEEQNKLNPPCEDEDEDYSKEEPIQSPEKLEEIRNNLKMQLSCLRTRKKASILQELVTKVVDDNNDVENHINVNIISSIVVPPPISVKVPGSPPLPKIKPKEKSISQKAEKQKLSLLASSSKKKGTALLRARNITNPVVHSSDIDAVGDSIQVGHFGPIIASVQGGVDDIDSFISGNILEPTTNISDPLKMMENMLYQNGGDLFSQEKSSSIPTKSDVKEAEVPSVLKDLRKIIRKQKTCDEPSDVKSVIKESTSSFQRDIKDFSIFNEISNSDCIKQVEESSAPHFLSECSLSNGGSNNAVSDTKSPFISNTLDEFLTENSKLNISYNLPKLDAEKGIKTDTYNEDSLLLIKKMQEAEERMSDAQRREDNAPKIKAKTLAEKRKLLEKSKTREERKIETFHKKQIEQKRSFVLFNGKKIWVRSRIPGQCLAKVSNIQRNDSVKAKFVSVKRDYKTPKKPSLLKDLFKQKRQKIKYKPGPLSKKRLLQEGNTNWETAVKKLPQVILEIKPEVGKPVNPNIIHLLPQNDGVITEMQIDFALSALKINSQSAETKTDHAANIFKFDVPYQNYLEKIIIRRRRSAPLIKKSSGLTKKAVDNVEEEVSKVISDLIRYVEIKELAPSLIKDCNSKIYEEVASVRKQSKVNDSMSTVVKKSNAKRSRIDIELLRLNCKIVNVKVDDSNEDNQCKNSYCQLGCICRSLSCEAFILNHCKKFDCMFNCSCPQKLDIIYDKELQLPSGTDILSIDTVSRIEDQAKRDMARVEREFTQTVICTDDKTIVVGVGGRNKSRRVTKVPKKYSDFFNVDEVLEEENKDKLKKRDLKLSSQCRVTLEKLGLASIIPYCLVHSLYYCHCRGTAVYKRPCSSRVPVNHLSTKPSSKIIKRLSTNKATEFRLSKETSNNKSVNMETTEVHEPEKAKDEVLYSVTGRPLRDPNKIKKRNYLLIDNLPVKTAKKMSKQVSPASESDSSVNFEEAEPGCARSRYFRSKKNIGTFLPEELLVLNGEDFVYNLTEADILKIRLNSKSMTSDGLTECDRLKIILLSEYKKIMSTRRVPSSEALTPESERKSKRKQTLQIRDDTEGFVKIGVNESLAIQRRKKKVKSVFVGEIIVTDPEWLQKLEENSRQMLNGYARLLPWTYLLSGYHSNDIKIYCAIDFPYRLVFCKIGVVVPATYLDIADHGPGIVHGPLRINSQLEHILRQCKQVQNVISWVISGNLPAKYVSGLLSFLLVEASKDQFEVRGLCNQIVNNNEPLTSTEMADKNDVPKPKDIQQSIDEMKHKDMNNKIQILYVHKQIFETLEVTSETKEHTGKISLNVNLPHIHRKCKWRMIHLNRQFAYLLFQKINYSIKYTDLDNISKRAATDKYTLILRNPGIMDAYSHEDFGIYFEPSYLDRIFIGPYFKEHSEEDVKTLRYFNKTLVNSELFNRMQGRLDLKCGSWLVEDKLESKKVPDVNVIPTATVDLTEDDDTTATVNLVKRKSDNTNNTLSPKRAKISTDPEVTQNDVTTSAVGSTYDHVIYYNKLPIFIKSSQGRSPDDYNKFIITNIPGFGYLGAFKPANADWIEVSWPYEKKVLQFETCDHAKKFLEYRFSQLLLAVPETFKIEITILDMLNNISCSEPINAEFLTGYCICGDFGTLNYKTLTDEVCRNVLGTTLEEVTKVFAKRAQAAVKKQIHELASVLELDKPNSDDYTITSVLNLAVTEIKKLEAAEKQYKSEIKRKEMQVIERIRKLYKMISDLPNFERNMESKIFNETLKVREYKPSTENVVIEIAESDEDEPMQIPTSNVPESKILQTGNEVGGNSLSQSALKLLASVKVIPPKISDTNNEVAGTSASQSVPKILGSDKVIPPKVAKVAPFCSSKKTIIISNYKSILKQNVHSSTEGIKTAPSLSTPSPNVPLNAEPVPRTTPISLEGNEPSTSTELILSTDLAQPIAGSPTLPTNSVRFSKKSPVKILPKPGFFNLADTVPSLPSVTGNKQNPNKEYRLVKVSNGTVVLMSKI